MTIGNRIKEIRTLRGLSQVQLADMMSSTVALIDTLESAEEDINLSTVLQLTEALQISADYLLFGIITSANKEDVLESKIRALIQKYEVELSTTTHNYEERKRIVEDALTQQFAVEKYSILQFLNQLKALIDLPSE